MKYTFRTITLILSMVVIVQSTIFSQCVGDNTFNGTIDMDWSNPGNWSLNCVPGSTVTGRIVISSNCMVNDNNSHTFVEGSILEIQPGVNFTNDGTGNWTVLGTIINNGHYTQTTLNNDGINFGEGSFYGNQMFNGTIEPGSAPPPTWNCGDLLSYAGRDYGTVLIGAQCWMAENLNIGTLLDGNLESHNNNVIEKYCYNNEPENCEIYGGLYSWMEMMGYPSLPAITSFQGLCPTGWHIPSDEEWMQLEGEVEDQYDYPDPEWEKLGFRGSNVGLKLKSTFGWNNSGNGTDDFGFNALPAGMRDHDASGADFFNQGEIAQFWTATLFYPFLAYAKERQFWSLNNNSYRGNEVSGLGYSVRCLKD